MNTIILAGLERGLDMQEIRRMQLGQVVGFIDDYNKRIKKGKEEEEHKKNVKHYRLATPKEVSAYARS